jgi:hypothetical protein
LQDSGNRGKYNVGWLSFRRDDQGLAALKWWRERCLEWCYDRPEAGRMADQMYLDDWPDRFSGVLVLQHKGANLAPWNLGGYWLYWRHNQVYVEEDPLIFFHFHGLKQVGPWLYVTNLASFHLNLSPFLRTHLFGPYIQALVAAKRQVSPLMEKVEIGRSIRDPVVNSPWRRTLNVGRKTYETVRSIIDRDYILLLD